MPKKTPASPSRLIDLVELEEVIKYYKALHVTSDGIRFSPLGQALAFFLEGILADLRSGERCVIELRKR